MKNYLLLICAAFSMYSCRTEEITEIEDLETTSDIINDIQACDNQLPQVRLTNNGTVIHNLEIYDVDMNLVVSVANLDPGETSEWLEFDPQEILVSLTNDNLPDEKVEVIMDFCTQFDMIIGINDLLESYDITILD